jgi:protein TonB
MPGKNSDEYRRLAGLFNGNDPAAKRIAILLAVFFHLFLIAVTIPVANPPAPPVIISAPGPIIVPPPMPRPPDRARPPRPEVRDLSTWMVPIPDETPEVPEPIQEPNPDAGDFTAGDAESMNIDQLMALPEGPPATQGFLRPGIDDVSNPIKTLHVDPVYPSMARTAGVEGRVILEVVVRADGRVGEIRVLSGPGGRFGFEAEAIRAVREWHYKPALQDGQPVGVYIQVVVRFTLED